MIKPCFGLCFTLHFTLQIMTYLVGPMVGKRAPGILDKQWALKERCKGPIVVVLVLPDFCKVVNERSLQAFKLYLELSVRTCDQCCYTSRCGALRGLLGGRKSSYLNCARVSSPRPGKSWNPQMLIVSPNPVSQDQIRREWEQLQWTEYKPHPQGLYFDSQMQTQATDESQVRSK